MERTMTPEERIRRAEEIYYRRRNQNLDRNSIRIGNDNTRPNFVIIKKDDITNYNLCCNL